ncbi:MAG: hypothetical protein ACRD35_07550 [Candidatus Acidiferrales bacterium]
MSWWRRYIVSVFNPRVLAQEIIKKQEEIYESQRRHFPGQEEHIYLAQVWLSRGAAYRHRLDPNDPDVQTRAFIETHAFACLDPPDSIRALGLYIVWKEHRDIIKHYVEFQEEFNRIMQPVHQAEEDGTIDKLYSRRNPKLASKAGVG